MPGRVLIHHQAPAVVDGVSPFLTPGTRLTWSTGGQWMAMLQMLLARPSSNKRHVDLASHVDELARHPDFIAAHQDLAEIVAWRDVVVAHCQPPRGLRAGTSYERVLNELQNAIARLHRLDARAS